MSERMTIHREIPLSKCTTPDSGAPSARIRRGCLISVMMWRLCKDRLWSSHCCKIEGYSRCCGGARRSCGAPPATNEHQIHKQSKARGKEAEQPKELVIWEESFLVFIVVSHEKLYSLLPLVPEMILFKLAPCSTKSIHIRSQPTTLFST